MTLHLDDLRGEELTSIEEYNQNHENQIKGEEAERLKGIFRTPEEVEEDVSKLAEEVNKTIDEDAIYVIGILNGATYFQTDLAVNPNFEPHADSRYIRINRYTGAEAEEGNAEVKEVDDLSVIEGSPVILVDELAETRLTLKYAKRYLEDEYNPSDITTVVYLDKRDRQEADVEIDHLGHIVDGDLWYVGLGMDITEKRGENGEEISLFRNKDYIAVHKPY